MKLERESLETFKLYPDVKYIQAYALLNSVALIIFYNYCFKKKNYSKENRIFCPFVIF